MPGCQTSGIVACISLVLARHVPSGTRDMIDGAFLYRVRDNRAGRRPQ